MRSYLEIYHLDRNCSGMTREEVNQYASEHNIDPDSIQYYWDRKENVPLDIREWAETLPVVVGY